MYNTNVEQTIGKLYVVATPIGNLEDITLRAQRILKEVGFVVAEDTRVSKNLLNHLGATPGLISFHAHSGDIALLRILKLLEEGHDIAYVTDAGTPGISDPGNELVSFLREAKPEINIIPVPGASSVITLASVAGINMQEFTFAGFAPKKKSQKYFKVLLEVGKPFIYLDTSHRVTKNLETIKVLEGGDRYCLVGREMTKLHETFYKGSVGTVLDDLLKTNMLKGELIVLVGSLNKKLPS